MSFASEFLDQICIDEVVCAEVYTDDNGIVARLPKNYTPTQAEEFLAALDFDYDYVPKYPSYNTSPIEGTVWYGDGSWATWDTVYAAWFRHFPPSIPEYLDVR